MNAVPVLHVPVSNPPTTGGRVPNPSVFLMQIEKDGRGEIENPSYTFCNRLMILLEVIP